MSKSRNENNDFRKIASELGLDERDVRRVVYSYFGAIKTYASSLPFNTNRKIFRKEKFDEYVTVFNIPYIGRIGPAYSRYLSWRRNAAAEQPLEQRSSFRTRMTQSELEYMTAEILAGRTPVVPEKKRKSELYDSVWMVGKDGKKLAKQVIKK